MRGRMPNIAWLWPGLPQLWVRGSWWGLALAVAFTLLLNVLLVASLVWTEWLRAGVLWGGWAAVALLWAASAWVSWTGLGEIAADGPQEDWFSQAQSYYLQGAWYEAETLLNLCLKRNRRDVQARLALATLKRRTGLLSDADEQLTRLARQDNLGPWKFELQREQNLLARDRAEQSPEEHETGAATATESEEQTTPATGPPQAIEEAA